MKVEVEDLSKLPDIDAYGAEIDGVEYLYNFDEFTYRDIKDLPGIKFCEICSSGNKVWRGKDLNGMLDNGERRFVNNMGKTEEDYCSDYFLYGDSDKLEEFFCMFTDEDWDNMNFCAGKDMRKSIREEFDKLREDEILYLNMGEDLIWRGCRYDTMAYDYEEGCNVYIGCYMEERK